VVGEDGKTPKIQTTEDYMQLRGMIKALRGVLGMGVTDPILNPEHKEK
jgi:ribonuclease HI